MSIGHTYKIAHFSDLHFCQEFDIYRQLQKFEELIIKLLKLDTHHFVFTGDLLEYANFSDLKSFFKVLEKYSLSGVEKTSLLPGNHDLYSLSFKKNPLQTVLNKNKLYENLISKFNEACLPYQKIVEYPLVKKINSNCVLVLVNSSAKASLTADQTPRGEVEYQVMEKIDTLLSSTDFKNIKYKILALHHYPFKHSNNPFCSPHIVNLEEVQSWIMKSHFKLVLSGHSHGFKINKISHIPVICSASGGDAQHMKAHLIELSNSISISEII